MTKNRIQAVAMVSLMSIVMALTGACATRSDDKIVKIDSGRIEGTLSGEVLSFKGIPYAVPPVAGLRWRAPQPVTPWRGVRPATE